MNHTTILAAGLAAALLAGAALAQPPAPAQPAPPLPPPPPAGSAPGEKPAVATEIPGVVAAGAQWRIVVAGFNNMDGIVGTPDGGMLFAQEQTHTIRKVDAAGREMVYLTDTHGAGAVSVDTSGRLFVVQRTCTDPGLHLGPACQELTAVSQLAPERRMLANSFPDGRTFGRVNDVVADGKGGAFFTSGGAWHVSADGVVATVEDKDIRSNGIMLSRDGRTLYVTNNTVVLAFDVQSDGSARGRRDFCQLGPEGGGDGMAIDGAGRLYVTGAAGVHVCAPDGRHLGVIPTPRRAISVAFSGPDKKELYIIGNGAVGPDGRPWTTPEGVRNTAMSMYKLPMLAEGFKGRWK